jgi:hypothetical protein
VLLPTGAIAAFSGADIDENAGGAAGMERAIHRAELFDGERWVPMAIAARDRTYHNSAILLPDGRVLVGGHAPNGAGNDGKPDQTYHDAGLTANNVRDASFETYSPPYLFAGPRPSIVSAPDAMPWNESSVVTTASAVDSFVLMHLPAATHATDPDQRGVELESSALAASVYSVAVPDANIVPPGYYYLFAVTGGVPSKAGIVRIGASPAGLAGFPFGH